MVFQPFIGTSVMQNLSKCIKRTPELRMRLMDNSSHALEVLILFFNRTVWTQKAKRAKRFYSLLCLLLRLTNRITDKWTVGYLSVHVFSTKVLIEDTIFASHTTDGTHIFCGYLSHAEVKPFAAGEGQFLQDISQSYQDRAIGPWQKL